MSENTYVHKYIVLENTLSPCHGHVHRGSSIVSQSLLVCSGDPQYPLLVIDKLVCQARYSYVAALMTVSISSRASIFFSDVRHGDGAHDEAYMST